MSLTVEQIKARQAWIGSSDIGSLLGVDEYRNLADLWLEKSGKVEPKVTTNEAATLGDFLEPALCEWLAARIGLPVERGQYRQSADGLLRAQLDGWVEATGETVEAKSQGLYAFGYRPDEHGWGEPGSDKVPFKFLAQVQFALMLSGAPRGHLVALLGGGGGCRHYVIEAHLDLQQEIERRARRFWTEHVIPGIPPAEVPSIETLKVVKREPGKSVEVDADLIERYEAIKEQEKLIAGAKEEAKEKLIHALGDADSGYSPFGEVTFYANKNGVRSLSVKERA